VDGGEKETRNCSGPRILDLKEKEEKAIMKTSRWNKTNWRREKVRRRGSSQGANRVGK
jgi:hypothetical protein